VVGRLRSRVDHAEKLCDAIKNEHIHNVLLLSVLGTGDSDCKTFVDFEHIEDAVKKSTDGWVILRNSFMQQLLDYWKRDIQKHSVLALSIQRNSRFAPIHFNDVVAVVRQFVFSRSGALRDVDAKHRQSIFILTGSEAIDGVILADMVCEAIDQPGVVRFMETSRDQVEIYLRSLRKRMRDTDYEGNREHDYPELPPPDDGVIEFICDNLDYTREGKTNYISDDMFLLTGRDPTRLIWHLKKNAKDFRPVKPSRSMRSQL
jgi:hypothetical protein